MDPVTRKKMGDEAVALARSCNYHTTGTVEFLMDANKDFYFLEMNTRLQVEHPVTEAVTGIDLVEWQLRVAAGEPLPRAQNEVHLNGHAVEARLYAEDAEKGFLPATGRLDHIAFPPSCRADSAVRSGDDISPFYDPMIAKLIVWDHDRPRALRRLTQALKEFQIVGVKSNVSFLASLVSHPSFVAAALNTGFIDSFRQLNKDPHHYSWWSYRCSSCKCRS